MKLTKTYLLKLVQECINEAESDAAKEAHAKGYVSAGWGHWKDSSGKVVAKTLNGKLVAADDTSHAEAKQSGPNPETEPIRKAAKKFGDYTNKHFDYYKKGIDSVIEDRIKSTHLLPTTKEKLKNKYNELKQTPEYKKYMGDTNKIQNQLKALISGSKTKQEQAYYKSKYNFLVSDVSNNIQYNIVPNDYNENKLSLFQPEHYTEKYNPKEHKEFINKLTDSGNDYNYYDEFRDKRSGFSRYKENVDDMESTNSPHKEILKNIVSIASPLHNIMKRGGDEQSLDDYFKDVLIGKYSGGGRYYDNKRLNGMAKLLNVDIKDLEKKQSTGEEYIKRFKDKAKEIYSTTK